MPSSPVRTRVLTAFLEPEQRRVKTELQRRLVRLDLVQEDPDEMVASYYNGETIYHIGLKFKWGDVSSDFRDSVTMFIDLFHQAQAAGGMVTPADMNPLERVRLETAHYKNAAMVEMANMIAAAVGNGTVSADQMVAAGFICPLAVF